MIALMAKYVVFSDGDITIIPKDACMCHEDLNVLGEPVSAGFFTITSRKGHMVVTTLGGSSTLLLDPRSEDAEIITKALKFI